jgi:hypothetical protein
MFVYVGGDWRDGFEYAWQEPDPEPDEGPGLTRRQLTPATGQGRGTASSTEPSPPTATVGSPTCGLRTRPADRRGVGGEVTHPDRQIVSAEVPFPGPTPKRAGGTATSTPAAAVRRELSETQQRDDVMAPG